jgi:Mlc titration factor MtfA (ptsG expression regulator)
VQAFGSLPLLDGLSADEKHRLQELVILFMHRKVFEGAHGLVATQAMMEVMQPKATDTVADPACGTGGFLLAT